MNLNRNKEGKYAYNNAKKFVEELYVNDNFEIIDSEAPFIKNIIENIRNDISRFNILEELDIPWPNFHKKLDRLESKLLKKTQI